MTPHATDGPAPARPWLAWEPGARVVVRRRVPGGYSDVLGELLSRDEDGVSVRTRRHGDVHVPATEIALGKIVPPPPAPRPR